MIYMVVIGPSENDCQSCADGFRFNPKDETCSSLCPNGNFYNQDKICELCTDNCLECLPPGSYCRQCSYPLSLDTSTHRCLTCCTTNITTDDCCQCPLIWDGKKKDVYLLDNQLCINRFLSTSIGCSNINMVVSISYQHSSYEIYEIRSFETNSCFIHIYFHYHSLSYLFDHDGYSTL